MVRHLLFDLDDTLYSPQTAMGRGIRERTISFVADYLGLDREAAMGKRRAALVRHGTTLDWLITEHRFDDPDTYFSLVHPESELAELPSDPQLRPFLSSLGMPMTVLTNGSRDHAVRVLGHLGVTDLFREIWDINRNNLVGKPQGEAYLNALSGEFSVEDTLFFDDNPEYVAGYERLGGRGILVSPWDELLHSPGLSSDTPRINSIYEIHRVMNAFQG